MEDIPGLPPAGFERDEELKKRTDILTEEAEVKAEQLDHHAINPEAFEPDRELQHLIQEHDALSVSKAQAGFSYFWIYTGQYAREVTKMKIKGAEVVQGNDPEAAEYKSEDTTRRVGDTILMRMRMDKHRQLEMVEEKKRTRQQEGVEAEIRETAHKYRDSGIRLIEGYNPTADRLLRTGTVPGLSVGGRK